MSGFSTGKLTIRYVLALTVVALLSLVSHVTLHYVLRSHAGSAATMNLTGRQSMLSQRIASMAAQYTLGDLSAHEPLTAATEQFKDAHVRLLQDHGAEPRDREWIPALHALYFDDATPLNAQIHDFIVDAQHVADAPPGALSARPALQRLFAASRSDLLFRLEQVVSLHQEVSERRLALLKAVQWLTFVTVLATLLLEAIGIFRPMVRRVGRHTAELQQLATVDPLTGALNRRSFHEKAAVECKRASRHRRPLCLMMLDVDHFKAINDTYGHPAGDAVLVRLAAMLRETIRSSDLVCRFGGEEFVLLLPETTLDAGTALADRLRHQISNLAVDVDGGPIHLTVSIGVGALDGLELSPALSAVDGALYEAKTSGRNRVVAVRPAPVLIEAA